MNQAGNFKAYRSILEKSEPPCLPFLGLYLQDLTFIEEVPTFSEQGVQQINWTKMQTLYKILYEILSLQKSAFNFEKVQYIQLYLTSVPILTQEELYKISKQKEPSVSEIQSEKKEKSEKSKMGTLRSFKSNRSTLSLSGLLKSNNRNSSTEFNSTAEEENLSRLSANPAATLPRYSVDVLDTVVQEDDSLLGMIKKITSAHFTNGLFSPSFLICYIHAFSLLEQKTRKFRPFVAHTLSSVTQRNF